MLTMVSIRVMFKFQLRRVTMFTVSKFTDYLVSHWEEFSLQADCVTFSSDRVRISFCLASCNEHLLLKGRKVLLSRNDAIKIQNCVASLLSNG